MREEIARLESNKSLVKPISPPHTARARDTVGYSVELPQRQLRYIEWKGGKNYDFQKVTFSTLFKLYIAGLGLLIPKRYHMLKAYSSNLID